MIIGGLQKTSLIDYPGNVCATVFLVGCNLRCPFCHNPQLVTEWTKTDTSISASELLGFFQRRSRVLDGVCITGGEPTIYPELKSLIRRIADLGLKTKLDTNGTNPSMLGELIKSGLVDYVAMDIKATPSKYYVATGVPVDMNLVHESIDILKKSSVSYEFRTTMVPGLITQEDLIEIARWINGGRRFALQQFRADARLLDRTFQDLEPYSDSKLRSMREAVASVFPGEVLLRGLVNC